MHLPGILKGKALVISHYVAFIFFWLILYKSESTSGLANTSFNLGMGLYAVFLGMLIESERPNYIK
jgi:hypothetical protein